MGKAESLIPFEAGQRVTEVRDGEHRIVRLIRQDDWTVTTEHGDAYCRLTGAAVDGRNGYQAIHTPGYIS